MRVTRFRSLVSVLRRTLRGAVLFSGTLVLVQACDSGQQQANGAGSAGGTIAISASAEPDILFPPLIMTAQGKQVADQLFDNLADIGDELNTVGDAGFKPRLARSWRWAPDSSWLEFNIDPRARWHDGTPVRAADVGYTFGLVKDTSLGSPLSSNLSDVDSVTTPDSLTARVWLRNHPPATFFRLASPVAILPRHVLANVGPADLRTSQFARAPIGSGRFRFLRWSPGTSVILTADTANFRGRPQADRVVWVVNQDYNAAALKFVAGATDFLDVVKPEFVERAASGGRRLVTNIPSLNYGYVGFNLFRKVSRVSPHPILGDRRVRRALVMAVDRQSVVRNVLDSFGVVAHGPVTRAIPTMDTSIGLPYDTAAARRLLDSAGWRREGAGVRTRDGRRLQFTLIVPSSSAIRISFAVLLQDQWKRIGADVKVEQLELSTFGARLESHDFDAMLNAWQIDPDPGSVRDEWMSPGSREGGYNFVSYSNPAFDVLVDSAARDANIGTSSRLYRQAYRILTDDAPAMWLYETRNVFGVSGRIEPTGMRADAWWAGLADWKVTNRR